MTNEQLARMAQNDPAAFMDYIIDMNNLLVHHYESLLMINNILWDTAKASTYGSGLNPLYVTAMQCQGISDGMAREQHAFEARWE